MLGGDNMQTYSNKDDLIFEISKRAELLLMNLVMYQNQIRMYIKLVSIEHCTDDRIPAWMVKFNSIVGE